MIQCLMFPALLAMATNLMAQGTVEDYRRAYSAYGKFNASQVYDDPSNIQWSGTRVFHYSTQTPEGTAYHVGLVEAEGQPAKMQHVDMDALAALLARET